MHAYRLLLALALSASLQALANAPPNFVTWRPGLASAGQPGAAWLQKVREARYDVVINLAPPQSHGSLANEGGLVGASGVVYVNIPVDFARPTAEDFRVFSEVVRAYQGRNIFVHCQINLRGSSFAFLYRVIHEGADPAEALSKLTGVWAPDKAWKRFIEETLASHGKKAEIL